ncbi:hypothetical protein ACFUPZ_18580 [Microbacterium oxydans]|uniref:hypothetical protein n=1 Tax=Microbacterium oxydans TaxID=82380 RepID=UPI00363826C8
MANNINIVITTEDKASKPIRAVGDEMEGTTGKSSKFKSALGAVGGALKVATLAAGAFTLATGTAGAVLGFNFNSQVEQAQTKLMAFTQDGEKVAKVLSWVKTEAAATQFSFTDMADAAANLTPVAKSSGVALEDLVRQAEILAAVNPAEGLTGATFSLREALSGDWVSIVDRFNLPRKRINELKAQGVPAMEIISKTLGEMGINYDLVAKQGQTVSARFDQVKDKLTMMAGAAAKPVFDRVSRELGALGDFDFQSLGDQLAGVVSGGISAFDSFLPKVRDVAVAVGDYLGPKFGSLVETIRTKVMPVLGDLWNNVLAPFSVFLGETLVWSIGAVVDTLNGLINGISWVVTEIQNGNPWVMTLATAFGVLGGALMLSSAFTAVTNALNLLTTTTIPAVIGKMTALKLLVSTPMIMPAIAVAAAIGALVLVQEAADRAKNAVEEAAKIKDAAHAEDMRMIGIINQQYKSGQITKEKHTQMLKIVGKASGTNSAQGGWELVGEHGPELRQLGQGDQIVPAYRTRSQSMPTSRGATIEQLIVHNHYPNDEGRLIRDIGFALELA